MGNPTLNFGTPERTPCRTCRHFGGWGEDRGKRYVDCAWLKRPFWHYETGCRYWDREPGTDDEEGPAEGQKEP